MLTATGAAQGWATAPALPAHGEPDTAAMAKRARSPFWRRWFSHRRLLLIELLLLVGLLEDWAERQVLAAELPDAAKVVFSMALVVGLFGGLLLLVEGSLRYGLQRTHDVVQALPLPTPLLLVHSAALFGLAWLWALQLDLSLW